MFEIIIIFIIVITSFVAIAWYAMRSTRRTTPSKEVYDKQVEPSVDEADAFSAVFKQEMTQHKVDSDLEAEPHLSLSNEINQGSISRESDEKQQKEIDFKDNDEIDVTIDITDEDEPSIEMVNDWDMVIAFTILAEEGHNFSGPDLKAALEKEQFHFGDMGIFHRLTAQKKVLFSAANILDPGTFDSQNMAKLSTPGILVFAKLPGPINGLSLFDEVLDTSRALTASLNGILCDDSRNAITEEIIESMRSRILNLNFSIHSETRETHVYTD